MSPMCNGCRMLRSLTLRVLGGLLRLRSQARLGWPVLIKLPTCNLPLRAIIFAWWPGYPLFTLTSQIQISAARRWHGVSDRDYGVGLCRYDHWPPSYNPGYRVFSFFTGFRNWWTVMPKSFQHKFSSSLNWWFRNETVLKREKSLVKLSLLSDSDLAWIAKIFRAVVSTAWAKFPYCIHKPSKIAILPERFRDTTRLQINY